MMIANRPVTVAGKNQQILEFIKFFSPRYIRYSCKTKNMSPLVVPYTISLNHYSSNIFEGKAILKNNKLIVPYIDKTTCDEILTYANNSDIAWIRQLSLKQPCETSETTLLKVEICIIESNKFFDFPFKYNRNSSFDSLELKKCDSEFFAWSYKLPGVKKLLLTQMNFEKQLIVPSTIMDVSISSCSGNIIAYELRKLAIYDSSLSAETIELIKSQKYLRKLELHDIWYFEGLTIPQQIRSLVVKTGKDFGKYLVGLQLKSLELNSHVNSLEKLDFSKLKVLSIDGKGLNSRKLPEMKVTKIKNGGRILNTLILENPEKFAKVTEAEMKYFTALNHLTSIEKLTISDYTLFLR